LFEAVNYFNIVSIYKYPGAIENYSTVNEPLYSPGEYLVPDTHSFFKEIIQNNTNFHAYILNVTLIITINDKMQENKQRYCS